MHYQQLQSCVNRVSIFHASQDRFWLADVLLTGAPSATELQSASFLLTDSLDEGDGVVGPLVSSPAMEPGREPSPLDGAGEELWLNVIGDVLISLVITTSAGELSLGPAGEPWQLKSTDEPSLLTPIEPDPELDLLATAWRSARAGELRRELRGLGDSGMDWILCRTGDAARLTNSKRVLVEVCLVTPNKSKTEIKRKKRKKERLNLLQS